MTNIANPSPQTISVGTDMTDAEINQWIDACNHEPAKNVLRGFLNFRAGIKRFSAEAEICGETMPGEDALNLVRMTAKLAAAEEKIARPSAPQAQKLVRNFEHVYGSLADLRSGLRTQGNYQVAGYVDRAVKALDDAISAVLANEPKAETFGIYVERADGTTEFRRTGETHTPTAQAHTFTTLYPGPAPARETIKQVRPAANPAEPAPDPEDARSGTRLSPAQKAVLRHCLDWSAAFEVAERRNDEGANTNWWRTQDILRALASRGLVRYGEANATYRITDKGRAEIGLSAADSSTEDKQHDL